MTAQERALQKQNNESAIRAVVREELKKHDREVHISEVIGAYGLFGQKVDADKLSGLIQAELASELSRIWRALGKLEMDVQTLLNEREEEK